MEVKSLNSEEQFKAKFGDFGQAGRLIFKSNSPVPRANARPRVTFSPNNRTLTIEKSISEAILKSKNINKKFLVYMEREKPLIIYSAVSTVYIVSVLINFAVRKWVSYCYWNFGLIYAETFTNINDFSGEDSIVDVIGDACGSLQTLIENTCPKACGYVENFNLAGTLMLCLSTLSILATTICIFFHLRVLSDSKIRLKTILLFMILPLVLYSVALLVYIGLGSFSSIKNDKVIEKNEAQGFKLKEGFYMACGNLGFCFCIFIYGLFVTKKIISKKNK